MACYNSGMPRVQEIIKEVKRERGRTGLSVKRRTWQAGIRGTCCQINEVTSQFPGASEWRSISALGAEGQVYPGHSLGVFPTRGKAGVVVDFTSNGIGGPVIADIRDVTKDRKVARRLKEVTGYSGWRRQRSLRG